MSTSEAGRMGAMEALNLAQLLGEFDAHWSPQTIADVNDYQVKLVKVAGEFVWHSTTTPTTSSWSSPAG
jgi:hypothetical protein